MSNQGSLFGRRWRKFKNVFMIGIAILSALLVIAPLFIIFFYTLKQGIDALNLSFFIHMPKPVGKQAAEWQMPLSDRS